MIPVAEWQRATLAGQKPAEANHAAEWRGATCAGPTLATPSTTNTQSRIWIIDSGSCFDLVNQSDLTKGEKHLITEGTAHRLLTANGVIDVKRNVELPLCSIESSTNALVMEDSPSVLSPG